MPGRAAAHGQRGVALLVVMMGLIVVTATVLISRVDTSVHYAARDAHNQRVLAEAKEALIGYVVRQYDEDYYTFGLLPCPDVDGAGAIQEGDAHSVCGARDLNALGRYPWRSMGTGPLRDADGECLWYAVSGAYKDSGTSSPYMINEDTLGTLSVSELRGLVTGATTTPALIAGDAPETRAAAVIIAPGSAVAKSSGGLQQRTGLTGVAAFDAQTTVCGGNYDPANYLDAYAGYNNGSLAAFSPPPEPIDAFLTLGGLTTPVNEGLGQLLEDFNDRITIITPEEIWAAIRRRADRVPDSPDALTCRLDALTEKLARCVRLYEPDYASGFRRVPWASQVDLDDYRSDNAYNDMYGQGVDGDEGGRLPDIVDDSNSLTLQSGNLITGCGLLTSGEEELWGNWKDHFFYALSDENQPHKNPSYDCVSGGCLSVNGNTPTYAAIVLFSNSPSGQDRRPDYYGDAETMDSPLSYLEAANASSIDNPTGYENYVTSSGSVNDILYCIRSSDLAVARCPGSIDPCLTTAP
jgi:hypothetical protein